MIIVKKRLSDIQKKICRSNSLSKGQCLSSGNKEIDSFIQDTKSKKKHCDDFIEWIPYSSIVINDLITQGGFSKIFRGEWKPLVQFEITNNSQTSIQTVDVVLKVLNGSKIFKARFLTEVI